MEQKDFYRQLKEMGKGAFKMKLIQLAIRGIGFEDACSTEYVQKMFST